MDMLKFSFFSSCMECGFWHKLGHAKLNNFGLDDGLVDVTGYYCNYSPDKFPAIVNIDDHAFDKEYKVPNKGIKVNGQLKITNTIEDFKSCDKDALIHNEGLRIWNDIISMKALQDPSLLNRFLLLTYADLKKFTFHYWCAFPALNIKEGFSLLKKPSTFSEQFTEEQISQFVKCYDDFTEKHADRNCHVFLAKELGSSFEMNTFESFSMMYNEGIEMILCICDPSTSTSYPGWPLKNLLTFISYHWYKELKGSIRILCLRDRVKNERRNVTHSLFLHVKLPDLSNITECPKVVGWEKDEKNSMNPKHIDLGSQMDPHKLCESAVDLNLKLMKWRLVPDLDLDLISSTRFLLLGSGTLGCNVARCLMGWGVRNITFVDNSKISFSNPVRQSLFKYEDCLSGGKPKAETAAESLKIIFPQINAVGIHLSIPMPGHFVSENRIDKVKQDVEQLERLIEEHDVVFLLMDSRESRWLPTLIGKEKSKIVHSVALGFDTYLSIRHGVRRSESTDSEEISQKNFELSKQTIPKYIPGDELGCYFCNDVTSPGNSTMDRTMDQQCTVTRPGVSMIAAATSVELAISLLSHPLRGRAPAIMKSGKNVDDDDVAETILGAVPHQIRGFLSSFSNILPANNCFDKCTACSQKVVEAYSREGFDFLLKVFNSPIILEDLTGLTQLHEEAANIKMIEFSEDEDGFETV